MRVTLATDELWLIGRILFCALFIAWGIGQLVDLGGSTQYAAMKDVGPARPVVIASSVAFIVGRISLPCTGSGQSFR